MARIVVPLAFARDVYELKYRENGSESDPVYVKISDALAASSFRRAVIDASPDELDELREEAAFRVEVYDPSENRDHIRAARLLLQRIAALRRA